MRRCRAAEELRVELRAVPRISIYEKVEEPAAPSNLFTRLAMTLMAMLAAFGCPVVVTVLWDSRVRRINTADDVSKRLRAAGDRLGAADPVPRHPSLGIAVETVRNLAPAADGIGGWNCRPHPPPGRRSTASRDYGVQRGQRRREDHAGDPIGLSLARTGRRTVLVDFDLRRPSFDEMFGMPLAPGVCEFLRDQNGLADLVRESGTDNLAVVTAGQWDRQAYGFALERQRGQLVQPAS